MVTVSYELYMYNVNCFGRSEIVCDIGYININKEILRSSVELLINTNTIKNVSYKNYSYDGSLSNWLLYLIMNTSSTRVTV